jgi:hypothetical protein
VRFIVANWRFLCHKPNLHRPADQGLPCRCPCGLFRFRGTRVLFKTDGDNVKKYFLPNA